MAKRNSTRVRRVSKKPLKYWFFTTLQEPVALSYPPSLALTGLWLLDAGFYDGCRVRIEVSNHRLLITMNRGDDTDA